MKGKLLPLLLSGIALGFNWILLFESYRHTTVSTATLCYYLAPILVILLSPVVLKETLTGKQLVCAAAALVGTVLVSGVATTGFSGIKDSKGILFGLGAAALYATVMLLNKSLADIRVYDKTIIQLSVAACALLPYTLLTENLAGIQIAPGVLLLLLVAGILHTGVAYWLYFGAIPHLPGQTVALYSYLDPIIAIILSTVVLKEPMSVSAMIGAVLILCAAFFSER
jgi:RarD protein